jgi:Zn-dependent protease with chaperone function
MLIGRLSFLVVALLFSTQIVFSSEAHAPATSRAPAQVSQGITTPDIQRIVSYQLPPEKEQKARTKYEYEAFSYFFNLFYELAVLAFILSRKWLQKMRDHAVGLYPTLWGQSWSVTPKLWLIYWLLSLPAQVFTRYMTRGYLLDDFGRSMTFFGWGPGLIGGLIGLPVLVWIIYKLIEKSPRRWWLYFGLMGAIFPIVLSLVEVFGSGNEFLELDVEHPELAARIQGLAARDHVQIPLEDLREQSVEYSSAPNAYASGFGSRRQIVIWTKAIAKLDDNQMSFVASHEIGHYRLNHPLKMLVFSSFVSILAMLAWFRLAVWLQRKCGHAWGIPNIGDWTSLPLLLLTFSAVLPVQTVAENIYAWNQEVEADQYAVELTHGVVPGWNQSAAQALQIVGEESLEYDQSSVFTNILLSDHPPMAERIKFVLNYDPWKKGSPPKFVRDR